MDINGTRNGKPNAIIFMGPDGPYMVMLDEEFTLYGDIMAFETADGYYNDVDETQIVFVEYDELEEYSVELARYGLAHVDGDEEATVVKAIDNEALQGIVNYLIDDLLAPPPTIH